MEEKKIVLSADTNDAVKNINELSSTVRSLQQSLSEIQKTSGNIDLSKFAPDIKAISSSLRSLSKSLKDVDFSGIDSSNIDTLTVSLNVVQKELSDTAKSVQETKVAVDESNSSIDITTKAVEGATTSIRDIRKEIRAYEADVISAAEGSEEQARAIVRLNEAYDRLEVAQVNVRNRGNDNIKIVQNTIAVTRQLASTFSVAQSALTLLGSDSEELNKVFVRLQATIALVQGLQGLGGFPRTLKNLRQALGAATISVQSFNAALRANPVGLIVSGITILIASVTAIIGIFKSFKKSSDDLTSSLQKVKTAQEQLEEVNGRQKIELQENIKLLERQIELNRAAGASEQDAISSRIEFYNLQISARQANMVSLQNEQRELTRLLNQGKKIDQERYAFLREQLQNERDAVQEYLKLIDDFNHQINVKNTQAATTRRNEAEREEERQRNDAEKLSSDLENVFLDSFEKRRKDLIDSYEKDRALLVQIYGENSDQVFNLEYRLQRGITQIGQDEQKNRAALAKQYLSDLNNEVTQANEERINRIDAEAKQIEVQLSEFYLRLQQIRDENGDPEEILQQIAETEQLLEEKRIEMQDTNVIFLEEYANLLIEQLSLESTNAEQRILLQEQLNSTNQKLSIERANQTIAQNQRETKSLQDEEAKRDRIRKLTQQRLENAFNIAASLTSSASQLLGEETAAGKAAAVASATISTYQSANSAYSALAGIPIAGPGLAAAAAAAAVVAGIANVKKILSTNTDTSSSATSLSPSVSTPSIPSIPTVPDISSYYIPENTGIDLQSTEERELNGRVYVLESDITDVTNRVKTSVQESSFAMN